MARYFLKCNYNGTAYNGWQVQPDIGTKTVQGTIQHSLSILVRSEIELVGCGRTDAGVHARGYVAHFDIATLPMPINDILYKVNKMLPQDISIDLIVPVDCNAHARFDAYSRSYEYTFHTDKDPFATFSFNYTYGQPSLDVLNQAASLLLKYNEFLPFCKSNSENKTNICDIRSAYWRQEGNRYTFYITSNRFLRGMIRLIVGMCINVDRGRLTLAEVEEALKLQTRLRDDWSVPGHGLVLTDILYPYSFE